jgi:hypothetical protein
MKETKELLQSLKLPAGDAYDLPTSTKRFPDGAQYRIEIPSVEGPNVLRAVLEEAEQMQVPVHRVSQGSGVMLLTDCELKEMSTLGNEAGVEVTLFVGPRAAFDIGAASWSSAGKQFAPKIRGGDQLVYALEDIKRGCELGIRGILIADEGLLWLVNEAKRAGQLPKDLVVKASVQIGATNPASVRMLEQNGASTYNIPTDLTLPMIAALRQAVHIPLDLYIEVPDNLGGFIRYYEISEIIRVGAPVRTSQRP